MTPAEIGQRYRTMVLAGTWSPDMAEQLLTDSDDPEAVSAEFQRQNQNPEARAALGRLVRRRPA